MNFLTSRSYGQGNGHFENRSYVFVGGCALKGFSDDAFSLAHWGVKSGLTAVSKLTKWKPANGQHFSSSATPWPDSRRISSFNSQRSKEALVVRNVVVRVVRVGRENQKN